MKARITSLGIFCAILLSVLTGKIYAQNCNVPNPVLETEVEQELGGELINVKIGFNGQYVSLDQLSGCNCITRAIGSINRTELLFGGLNSVTINKGIFVIEHRDMGSTGAWRLVSSRNLSDEQPKVSDFTFSSSGVYRLRWHSVHWTFKTPLFDNLEMYVCVPGIIVDPPLDDCLTGDCCTLPEAPHAPVYTQGANTASLKINGRSVSTGLNEGTTVSGGSGWFFPVKQNHVFTWSFEKIYDGNGEELFVENDQVDVKIEEYNSSDNSWTEVYTESSSSNQVIGNFMPQEGKVYRVSVGNISHYQAGDVGGVVLDNEVTAYVCTGVIIVDPPESCIDLAPKSGSKYILSAWVREGDNANVETYSNAQIRMNFVDGLTPNPDAFTAKGTIIEGWQRIEEIIEIPLGSTSMSIELINAFSDGTQVYFDDIRLFPFDANMVTYVYDPISMRLVAQLDANNYATYYIYNESGALEKTKIETERGIQTISEGASGL